MKKYIIKLVVSSIPLVLIAIWFDEFKGSSIESTALGIFIIFISTLIFLYFLVKIFQLTKLGKKLNISTFKYYIIIGIIIYTFNSLYVYYGHIKVENSLKKFREDMDKKGIYFNEKIDESEK